MEDDSGKTSNTVKDIGIVVGVAGFVLLASAIFILWKKRKLQRVLKWKTEKRGDARLLSHMLVHIATMQYDDSCLKIRFFGKKSGFVNERGSVIK